MKENNDIYCRKDKTMHIMERLYTQYIIKNIIHIIGRSPITPNMITIFNIFLSFCTLCLAYKKHFFSVAILIQIYALLDNLDGILARYKNMKSKLGAKLDAIGDTIFYNLILVFIGINLVDVKYIVMSVVILNLYGIVATYYIVPKLKKLRVIKRDKLKKFFLDNGYIIGMNIDTAGIIMFLFLVINKISLMYKIIIVLFVIDLIYRIIELKINENLKENRL